MEAKKQIILLLEDAFANIDALNTFHIKDLREVLKGLWKIMHLLSVSNYESFRVSSKNLGYLFVYHSRKQLIIRQI